MSRAATPCHLLIAGLMLASAARASAQAQAPAQAPTQAPAQGPGPVEAPAPVPAPPGPGAFSCPVRGPVRPRHTLLLSVLRGLRAVLRVPGHGEGHLRRRRRLR